MAPGRDAELVACIEAATDLIESTTGYRLRGGARAVVFDGSRAETAAGDALYLSRRYPNVINAPGQLLAVTENGAALTVAAGYSTSAGVLIDGPGIGGRGQTRLRRYGGPWAADSPNNVRVSFWSGYDAVGSVPLASPEIKPVPPYDLMHLVREVAWLVFSSPAWTGKSSTSTAGTSTTWEKKLSPVSQVVYERLVAESW